MYGKKKRTAYNLPEDLIDTVVRAAEADGQTISREVETLLFLGLERWVQERIEGSISRPMLIRTKHQQEIFEEVRDEVYGWIGQTLEEAKKYSDEEYEEMKAQSKKFQEAN